MIWALAVVGYALIGLFTARRIFTYAVKSGEYENIYGEVDTHTSMFFGGVFWPFVPVILACWGIGALLTSNPPETNRQREAREAAEKREMKAKIERLEKELGVGK
jgi:hypothetical protein